ncbi:MAG: BREX-1 system adenine-specific DNA-methyltransferase PglX, partial [Candidatus Cloacimonetes bacterium]|nr:BREX-1 system adenine-specific DNA-methyltransferase PglX [Candidatus Cloacimonadota bacterium]MDY0230668.1 BREX-1 system adenine-specific DNA-methyltransferase PglX [Candidatus Cloacimonadaceae bacterium]
GGEVVQTTTFIIRNINVSNYVTTYYDLTKSSQKMYDFLKKNPNQIFQIDSSEFIDLPKCVLAYKISRKTYNAFFNKALSHYAFSDGQILTGNNEKYLRLFWEVNVYDVMSRRWALHDKGGLFRKWFGNVQYTVDFSKQAITHYKKDKIARFPKESILFRQGVTWTLVSSQFGCRLLSENVTFDKAAATLLFENENYIPYLLGLMNSSVSSYLMSIFNPTINNSIVDVLLLPVIIDEENKSQIEYLVNENIVLARQDWDSFETSWDFKKHPLLSKGVLSKIFNDYKSITKLNFDTLKSNEEELNEYFIKLYGLQDELSKDVDDSYVSISVADKERDTKSLISYLVGVLMGRYSLSQEGLVFAGGTFDPSKYGTYDVDSDGIIPIYSDISIKDGLVHRIIGLIKKIYGIEYYRENIGFIAEALGKKSNETSEETLNRYLNDGFYQDHLKTYQKRPIYWMFSSGKSSGFKCLIYMQRYSQDTLAKINAGYFQPATTILRNQITEIERQISIAADSDKRLLEKKRMSLTEQLNEARDYGQVLDYMANKYISIDLDDGVKVNYAKFQGIEVTSNGGKVKKDLLVPIK